MIRSIFLNRSPKEEPLLKCTIQTNINQARLKIHINMSNGPLIDEPNVVANVNPIGSSSTKLVLADISTIKRIDLTRSRSSKLKSSFVR